MLIIMLSCKRAFAGRYTVNYLIPCWTKKMNWYHISTGQFGYPQPEDSYLDETYDLTDGCPTCEIGKRLKNQFRFRSEPKAKHSQFLGLNWVFDEIFVRDVVKSIFEDEQVIGVKFTKPILHKTGQPLKTIYHMLVDTVLPPSLNADGLKSEKCERPKDPGMIKFLEASGSSLVKGPFCGSTKYNYPRGDNELITMFESTFSSMPDVVRMSEWFGSGGTASRPILVSERVKEIVNRMKWRGLIFRPIKLINK